MKSIRLIFLILALSLLNYSALQAAITTYTDLTTYQAALSATEEIENFNSATVGNFTDPINVTGFNFFRITGHTDGDNVGIFAGTVGGNIDATQYLGWNGSGNGPTYTFIFDAVVTAFAFQWRDTDPTDVYRLVVTVNGVTSQYCDPPFSTSTGTGFFGIISDVPFTQATIENQAYGGTVDDFGLDNFRMAPVLSVTTDAVSNVGSSTATSGGTVTVYNATVTARGVCWNTTGTPTTADPHTTDGSGSGAFTSLLTGLLPTTTYYVRAYAVSAMGTAYGNEVNLTTSVTIPTLSEWGMILFTLLLGTAAIFSICRKGKSM
jgi:hypothetical protein